MYEIWQSGAFHNNENLTTFPVEEYHIMHMQSDRQLQYYCNNLQILSIHNL